MAFDKTSKDISASTLTRMQELGSAWVFKRAIQDNAVWDSWEEIKQDEDTYEEIKKIWDKVGGFSEEFNPGDGSDSDFNMKLWKKGVRLFKGLNDFKVYNFGSISMRKKADIIKNDGTKTFLKKYYILYKLLLHHVYP